MMAVYDNRGDKEDGSTWNKRVGLMFHVEQAMRGSELIVADCFIWNTALQCQRNAISRGHISKFEQVCPVSIEQDSRRCSASTDFHCST
jgi:hypothetical protein